VTPEGVQDSRVCLSQPYHLSYPQVFRCEEEIYMIPETAAIEEIVLFRAKKFPYEWERVKTLLNVRAADSTVLSHGGKWWLLTTAMVVGNHAVTNLLFVADHPAGEWTLVDSGAYCDDARLARGAGAFIAEGADVWRPSQDCGGFYGKRIRFNRVESLSLSEYRETEAFSLEPRGAQDWIGVHTYNKCGDWEVIDACFSVDPAEVM
jgi:hypothetical protein